MDRIDDVSTEENILVFNAPDEALERAAALTDGPAWTMNFCTYNYYQCGPIGAALSSAKKDSVAAGRAPPFS
jgi:hypothetical protein